MESIIETVRVVLPYGSKMSIRYWRSEGGHVLDKRGAKL